MKMLNRDELIALCLSVGWVLGFLSGIWIAGLS